VSKPPSHENATGSSGGVAAPPRAGATATHLIADPLLRVFAISVVATGIAYVVNNYLVFWRGWPGLGGLFGHYGWFGIPAPNPALDGNAVMLGWMEVLLFLGPVVAIAVWVFRSQERTLHSDSELLSNFGAYIVRSFFWGVLFVGLADAVISFLRVENMLPQLVGQALAQDLGRANFRGDYVHYPLIALGFVVGLFIRSIGFTWLAALVVVAELQIVILRFIFSYEQAFMADLVRFWYGALFLFASAYTLLHEGHVRVDVLYANMSTRAKAWSNTIGSLVLGAPVCWVVMAIGMSDKSNIINSPLINYEVTQAGFGMYVKYLMAGFLAVYALTMLIQFMSYFLNSVGILFQEADAKAAPAEEAHF
jgi:TRAP-type mannitol/chloroaromatic compound transport system permease small subunit